MDISNTRRIADISKADIEAYDRKPVVSDNLLEPHPSNHLHRTLEYSELERITPPSLGYPIPRSTHPTTIAEIKMINIVHN
jgi:hypothetical protein